MNLIHSINKNITCFIHYFAVFSLMLMSCKKEKSAGNNEEKRISRFEILQSGFNEKAVFTFSFDNLNRVTRFAGYIYNPPYITVLPGDTLFNMEFQYNASTQLPKRVIQRITWPGSIYTRTHDLTYDNTNNVKKDSITVVTPVTGSTTVINYRTNGNALISELAAPLNTSPLRDSLVMINGNIVFYERRLDWNRYMQIDYEFGTSINPLNTLNIAPIFHLLTDTRKPENEYFSIWTLCNKNNVKSVTYKYDGVASNQYNMSYIMNADGTPVKRYWHNNLNSAEIVDTLFYHY